jgi:peptidoglycan/LPS O-acetylase OafA/YrhL
MIETEVQQEKDGLFKEAQRESASAPISLSFAPDPASYRPDIDGLRGFAVLSVIGYHARIRGLYGGFTGVDVFFVISGFLISTIIFSHLEQGRFSFTDFYARRVRRIFPALIVVLLGVGAFGGYVLLADEYSQLGRHIVAGTGFLSNLLLWREAGYFDTGAQFKPLLHLWSLAVEEQYYLIWPLMVFLIWKRRFRLLTILCVLLISFSLNFTGIAGDTSARFYFPHTRFWELLAGGVLAYVHLYKRASVDAFLSRLLLQSTTPRSVAILQSMKAVLGLAMVTVAVVVLNEETGIHAWKALMPVVGTILLISAGSQALINRYVLSAPVIVFVGLISYPLYLWHWPLLSFLQLTALEPPSLKAKLVVVAGAFVLAWLTYQFLERPIRSRKRTPREQRMLLAGMLAACIMGAFIVIQNGLPNRFSHEFLQLATYYPQEHNSGRRINTCTINLEQDWRAFVPTCLDDSPKDGPLLFLWGDSHASDLYPGLHRLQQTYKFRIAQYNESLCPPMLHFENPKRKECRVINDWVFAKITKLHPDTVILAAQYWFFPGTDTHSYVLQTVKALKGAGIRHIVIVGPSAEWKEPLPRSLFKYSTANLLHKIPDRLNYHLKESAFKADEQFRNWGPPPGTLYVSEIGIVCNEAGCLTRVEEDGLSDLLAFDEHHLSEAGSQYVVDRIFSSLFTTAPVHIDSMSRNRELSQGVSQANP